MRWLSALASLSFATFGYAVVGPGVVTGNTAVHDPTMCKDNSGKYFVFCKPLVCKIFCNSESPLESYGCWYRNQNVYRPNCLDSHRKSVAKWCLLDRPVHWYIQWVSLSTISGHGTQLTTLNSNLWAPDCTVVNGQFFVSCQILSIVSSPHPFTSSIMPHPALGLRM